MGEHPQHQQGTGGAAASARLPLGGLTVVDLSTSLPGGWTTQFLADAGADVIMVEAPGGGPLRGEASWPSLARGKRSVALDLADGTDRATLTDLIRRADVLVDTFRPKTAARLGLAPDALAALNPRLVSASITGWGSTGPWADHKGYEALVMARLGLFHEKARIVTRPGPAFSSVPFASWGAAQTALHGILAALVERESSGLGQHVEADLVRGVQTHDTWDWFAQLIGLRWPDAFKPTEAFSPAGEPLGHLIFPLLIAPTKDGHWLQFAQVEPRLFLGMLEELGMTPMLGDPKWKGLPILESQELRTELWEIMIQKVGERTLADWRQVFETNPNIMAEVFATGPDALDHPQLVHDGRVVEFDDPVFGPVRQPSTLVHAGGRPLSPPRAAPGLDEHGTEIRAASPAAVPTGPAPTPTLTPTSPGETRPGDTSPGEAGPAGGSGLPLAGLTILEFGVMYAAPFGSTLLTDLGARVIKVESRGGDTIRNVLPFPECGGAKVMQGKESIALDLGTEDGRRIVHDLARRADVVLQPFRAGAAERAGVDEATLTALNPDLVYVSAPGYGTDGPYGARPAYAPSIGAASGLALTDAPDAAGATRTLADIKTAAVRLMSATAVPNLQADGIAALGVASTILLGVLARARHRPLPPLTSTMIATSSHALLDRVVDYPGRPAHRNVDPEGYGYTPLYRMYRAADRWIFLAAPAEGEWADLVAALAAEAPELAEPRFATPAGREAEADALAEVLARVFASGPAAGWEERLTAAEVGCVVVREGPPAVLFQTDEALAAAYTTTAVSPIFDEYLRPDPTVRFSRSATQARGGCLAGQHTDAILAELGYDEARIADLRDREVIG